MSRPRRPIANQVEDGEPKPDQQNAAIHSGELAIHGERGQEHDRQRLHREDLPRHLRKRHRGDQGGDAEGQGDGHHGAAENGTQRNAGHPLGRRHGPHGQVVWIKADEDDTQEKGREPETHGCAHHPFNELLRKEDDESQPDAEEDESDHNVHGYLLLYTGAAVVSTAVMDVGRFCACAEYRCSRIEKADRAAGNRNIPAMVNGRV